MLEIVPRFARSIDFTVMISGEISSFIQLHTCHVVPHNHSSSFMKRNFTSLCYRVSNINPSPRSMLGDSNSVERWFMKSSLVWFNTEDSTSFPFKFPSNCANAKSFASKVTEGSSTEPVFVVGRKSSPRDGEFDDKIDELSAIFISELTDVSVTSCSSLLTVLWSAADVSFWLKFPLPWE